MYFNFLGTLLNTRTASFIKTKPFDAAFNYKPQQMPAELCIFMMMCKLIKL